LRDAELARDVRRHKKPREMRWTKNDSQPTTASATVFTKPLGKLGSEKEAGDGKRGRIRIRDTRKKRKGREGNKRGWARAKRLN